MTKNIEEQIAQIHREFRSMMNGPISQSMREKGLRYKVIFGVELPRLAAFAETLPHTRELAQTLWKENIRESRVDPRNVRQADDRLRIDDERGADAGRAHILEHPDARHRGEHDDARQKADHEVGDRDDHAVDGDIRLFIDERAVGEHDRHGDGERIRGSRG